MYNADTDISKIKFVREASVVMRCHTVPHLGEYSVGLHSFNMLAMLRILHPNAPLRLIWAILEHDVPERLTGDIPAPTKWTGVVDRSKLVEVETKINAAIFGVSAEEGLTQEEAAWLRGLDILELYMWCRDQEMLGNKNVRKMMDRISNFIKKNTHQFAPVTVDVYYSCRGDTWEMMPDLGEAE